MTVQSSYNESLETEKLSKINIDVTRLLWCYGNRPVGELVNLVSSRKTSKTHLASKLNGGLFELLRRNKLPIETFSESYNSVIKELYDLFYSLMELGNNNVLEFKAESKKSFRSNIKVVEALKEDDIEIMLIKLFNAIDNGALGKYYHIIY